MQHLIAPILFLCSLVAHPPLRALGLAFHSLLGRGRNRYAFKTSKYFYSCQFGYFCNISISSSPLGHSFPLSATQKMCLSEFTMDSHLCTSSWLNGEMATAGPEQACLKEMASTLAGRKWTKNTDERFHCL